MDKKRIASDKLVDKTFGKSNGKGNITEAWQRILQEQDHDFHELNELLKNAEVFKSQEQLKSRSDAENDLDEFYLSDSKDDFQLSRVQSLSSGSIQPGPITLNSELKGDSFDSDLGGKTRRVLPQFICLSTCCTPAKHKERLRLQLAQKEIRHCDAKISQYFHQFKSQFTSLETLLKFQNLTPSRNLPNVINLVAAQVWFVTFALAREMTHSSQLDRQSTVFFRKKYQVLLSYARRLSVDAGLIGTVLARIEEKATKLIRKMKEALTGKSTTDLVNTENTANDDLFVNTASMTELCQSWAPRHVNQFDPKHEPHSFPTLSSLLQRLDRPDSLGDRKQLEIFVRNITKSGWTNYEQSFTPDNRMKFLQTLLSETLSVIANTTGRCEKIRKRLIRSSWSKSHSRATCTHTLLPWFRDTRTCVNFCVKSPVFGPTEHEFLRFYILSAEVRLKGLCYRTRSMITNLLDVAEVSTQSCDLLEKGFELMIPNYSEIRSMIKLSNSKEKAIVTKDCAMAEFYLNGYGNVLKQVPIAFRVSRFILSNKVLLQERHSGVDFGIRFFGKSQPYLSDHVKI